jgi:hypothetical protein
VTTIEARDCAPTQDAPRNSAFPLLAIRIACVPPLCIRWERNANHECFCLLGTTGPSERALMLGFAVTVTHSGYSGRT